MKPEATPEKHKDLRAAIEGCLLGMAVGDALGLPYEGLAPRRAARLFGEPDRHRFFFGRGMMSDDTEHACMTAQAFIATGGDPDRFARNLAWRLRGWIIGLPAGIGYGTLRAILRNSGRRCWQGGNPAGLAVLPVGLAAQYGLGRAPGRQAGGIGC